MKFEIVFKKKRNVAETNELLQKLFGVNCNIDWRDDLTVEIRSDEVITVENIDYEKD